MSQVTKEAITPQPTLARLLNDTIASFRSRKLDNSGFGPWSLPHAVLEVFEKSGLTSQELYDIATQQTILDPESLEILLEEAREKGSHDPELIGAAKIILEQIRTSHQDVQSEEDNRVRPFRQSIEGKSQRIDKSLT